MIIDTSHHVNIDRNTENKSINKKEEEHIRIYILRQKSAPAWWDLVDPEEIIVGYTLCFETAENWAKSSYHGCDRKYTGIFPIPASQLLVINNEKE